MTHYFLKIALPIFFFATIWMLIIHAQPYHDDDLRTLLSPNDCAAPCFLGIQPGVTSEEQAREILDHHPWIRESSWSSMTPGEGQIRWSWNDYAPALLRPDYLSNGAGSITFRNNVVEAMQVMVSASAARLWMMWGKPIASSMSYKQGIPVGAPPVLDFSLVYPEQEVLFQGVIHCPYYPQIWDNHQGFMSVHWSAPDDSQNPVMDGIPNASFTRQIILLNRGDCQP